MMAPDAGKCRYARGTQVFRTFIAEQEKGWACLSFVLDSTRLDSC
jgi:hypothetical protein